MRITGWEVDGYGVLAGQRVEDLAPGLSVVLGPNEAGKTTLLDFLRGVLFGFPDRRSRLPYREPLHGGRHGGRVQLLDPAGRPWALTRYVGVRELRLAGPDGSVGGEEALRQLLGGADAGLFRSVFAFGLDELASLSSLDSDEVREAVFSAGVLGAGRTAARAARALRLRRDELARPRRSDAIANGLLTELTLLDEELREARRAAGSYPAVRAEELRRSAEVARARKEADRLRAHLVELDRLVSCWPVDRRRQRAAEAQAAGGALDQRCRDVLAARGRIERLVAERTGHDERVGQRDGLASQLAGIERERSRLTVQLGGLAEGAASPTGDAATLVAEAERLVLAGRDAHTHAEAARHELDRAEAELAAVTAERRSWAGESGPVPAVPELERYAIELEALRAEVAERDRLRAECSAAQQSIDLARLAGSSRRRHATSPIRLLALLGVLGLLLGAIALVAFSTHRPSLAGALGAASLALLAAVAVLAAAGRRPARDGEHDTAQVPTALTGQLAHHEAAAAERAAAFGLGPDPTAAEVVAAAGRLAGAQRRREHDSLLARNEARAAAARDDAARRLAARVDALRAVDVRVAELCRSAGLRHIVGAETLVGVLAARSALASLDAAQRRVEVPLRRLAEDTASFERRVGELASALLVRLGHDDAGGPAAGDTSSLLAALEAELREAVDRATALEVLARTLGECDDELARQLGTGHDGDRLRATLAAGDVPSWERERTQIVADLDAATAAHESAVAGHREAELARAELERSADVAALELQRGTLGTALDAALEEWLVLGLAEALLEETLARYERERQPLVVARAAELFARVTAGRYPALVAREDPDGGRAHAIDAIASDGGRVDCAALSRGTAEQLYLCLRLAYAATFAEQAVALPLVLDDVLVNFDPERARAVAGAIAATAEQHQVLFFTCHPHVVELLCSVAPGTTVIELPARLPASAAVTVPAGVQRASESAPAAVIEPAPAPSRRLTA